MHNIILTHLYLAAENQRWTSNQQGRQTGCAGRLLPLAAGDQPNQLKVADRVSSVGDRLTQQQPQQPGCPHMGRAGGHWADASVLAQLA
jgi:hypothetical protein